MEWVLFLSLFVFLEDGFECLPLLSFHAPKFITKQMYTNYVRRMKTNIKVGMLNMDLK